MGLEFNATLLAQIVDLLLLILFIAGIIAVIKIIIPKVSFKKDIYNKIETLDSELKEIRMLLEEKKR